jgi:alpha-tubulin suppressor-like RCC1 family protein
VENSTYTDEDSGFVPKIGVKDIELNSLVCKIYIDDETTQRDTKTAVVTPGSQTYTEVAFNPINIEKLSEGAHKIIFDVSNGAVSRQITVNFTVTETSSGIKTSSGSMDVVAEKDKLTITGKSLDVSPGLVSKPYRVKVYGNGSLVDDSGAFSENINPVAASSNVVGSAYSTAGNGGRKLVKLGNGWLAAGVINGSSDIRFYVSKDNGATWSLMAYRKTGTTVNGLALTAVGNMLHYLTTTTTRVIHGKIEAMTATGQDITASGITLDTQASVGACSLYTAPDGHIHAVWSAKNSTVNTDSYNLNYMESTDGGSSWSERWTTTLNTAGYDWTLPCIVSNQDGNPVIFARYSDPESKAIKCFINDGSTWSPEITIYDGGAYDQTNPCAVVDSDGELHVVWEGTDSVDTSVKNIRYSCSSDGTTWPDSAEKLTTGNSYAQTGATITADGFNNLYVLWSGRSSGSYNQIRKTEYKNGEWIEAVNLTANTSKHANAPSACNNAGFSEPPYIYSDAQASAVKYSGTVNTGISYTTKTLLTPNTKYNVKLEVTSISGNVQTYTRDIYTLMDIPTVKCNWKRPGELTITLSDINPDNTEYMVMCGNRYVNKAGELTTTPAWIEIPEKSITVTGLQEKTEYMIKVKARNGERVETDFVVNDTAHENDTDSVQVQVTDLSRYVAVAGGYYHTVVLKDDSTVWAWGYNNYGQLGDGTAINRNTPVQVPGLSGIKAIACGYYHTVALKDDGTVWAWGYNYYGQLGDGTTTNRNYPVQVPGLSGITAIASGYYHTIALKDDGTVWTWGYNNYGQLGDGTAINRNTPVQVPGLSGITAIAGGNYHTVALKNDGKVWAWGYNYYGQLGDGTTTKRNKPVRVSGLSGITAIACGTSHTIALKNNGTVWTWGDNAYGQLGDGTTTKRSTPAQVVNLDGIIAIAGGKIHTVALKDDGTVWAWGYNNYGQLGDGTTTEQSTPVRVSGLSGITAIAGGGYHTVTLKDDGTVSTWGYNIYGQLGDGTYTNQYTAVQITELSRYVAIAGGYHHTIALKNDSTVWTWGYNGHGQLGDGTVINRNAAVQAADLDDVMAAAGGQYHTATLKNDGTVWTWGDNAYGQLGDGTTTNRSVAVQVVDLSDITAIACGANHTIALKNDGMVWTWGDNTHGQLGDETTTKRSTPAQVVNLDGIIAIAGGKNHTVALKDDGTVWTWGDNTYGQLGDGTTTSRSTPVKVTGLSEITAIACGANHTIALKNDGTVWTWGDNTHGQLGDGATTNRSIAVQAAELGGIRAISGGYYHSVALKEDGTVWAWGYNYYGQLGDGTTSNRNIAVRSSRLGTVTAIAAGSNSIIALKDNGAVWTCGFDGNAQLSEESIYFSLLNTGLYGNMSELELTVTGPMSITLTWQPIDGALSYDIQRDGHTSFNTTGTSINDTDLLPNRKYTYRIRAVAADGYGPWGEPISKYTLANVPAKGSLGIAKGGIKASWDANGNPIGTEYVLAAFNASGTLVAQNSWTASLADILTGLSASASYNIKVKARNAEGIETDWCDLGYAMPTPAAPAINSLSSHGTFIEITWASVPGAVWYDVEADGVVIEKAAIKKDISNQCIYKHTGLKPLSQHTYRVRARNLSGTGEWSQLLIVMTSSGIPTSAPRINPNPPRYTNTTVTLTWDEVIDAEAYEVAEIENGLIKQILDNGNSTTCEKRGLVPLSTHTYKVRAKNSMAEGPWSDPVTITTCLLDTPGNITTVESDDSILFSWSAVTDATSYELKINNESPIPVAGTTYTLTGLAENSMVTYSVRAVNAYGVSAWSLEAPAYTLPKKPAIPQNVNATVTDTSITITWDEVRHSDGSSLVPPEGYDVELDGVLLENDTSTIYIHNELEPYTMHTYRVRARNMSVAGDWSPMQRIRTLPGKPKAPKGIIVKSTQTGATISWAAEPGATGYDIELYDGFTVENITNLPKTSYTHRRIQAGYECKYRIRTRNPEGISEWSGYIVNNALKAVCKKKENVDLGLTATDVMDFSPYTMVVTYNPDVIEVTDLCTLSEQIETEAGKIEGTEIEILEFTPGSIVFKVTKVITPGEAWTGVINSIKFKAKETGGTTITYTVFCEPAQ